jgi:hypothetical protein
VDENDFRERGPVPASLLTTLLLAALTIIAMPGHSRADTRIDVRTNPSQLDWSLFRRVDSIPDSSEDARIAAEISFPEALKVERTSGGYRLSSFAITVAPEGERTVVRRSTVLTEYLLRHEQGHYDIVVLAARALARELETMSGPSGEELSHRVQQCVDRHTDRAQALSATYDRETDRSRNPAAQERWLKLIAAAFSNPQSGSLANLPL